MEFVEDHAAHAGQIGGILQHPGQDAFGHHLDARVWPHDAFAAHAVTHGLAHGLAHRFGHALGGGARGQAARLEHHDPPLDLAQKGRRHTRRFACPRRGLQHGAPFGRDCGTKGGQDIVDGQGQDARNPVVLA